MKRVDREDTRSLDVAAENIVALSKIFPAALVEGKVDFDLLRQLLGESVVSDGERYGLHWSGKSEARRIGLLPTTGTLLPCREDSVDWESTRNLFIEGDNLEVLKTLLRAYSNRVKAIYIDPPYNTGKEFVYSDDFKDTLGAYLVLTGQAEADGSHTTTDIDKNGRFHSRWLSMMYPRLQIARMLLRKDGVIFLNIDDNEVHHLRCICNEIFGDENFVSELIWHLPSGPQAGHFTRSHETVLVYAKRKSDLPFFFNRDGGTIRHGALKSISSSNPASEVRFKKGSIEFEGEDAEFPAELGNAEKQFVTSGTLRFENGVLAEDVTIKAGWAMRNQLLSWLDGKETVDSQGQRIKRFYFNTKGILFYEKERATVHPKTVLKREDAGDTRMGGEELIDLFGANVMSFPKPSRLVRFLLGTVTDSEDIVVDFFAGSATTGDAVFQLNHERATDVRFILVQLPEKCPEDSDAYRLGCRTVAEIGRERIRRKARKIKDGDPDRARDLGFKAFKLADSNIRTWRPDKDNLKATLLAHEEQLVPGRNDEDILYEIMLKRGIDLVATVETATIAGHSVHTVKQGALVVCLSEKIRNNEIGELAKGIAELGKELATLSDIHVVFRDSAFEDDSGKVDMASLLDQHGIAHVRSL